VYLLKELDISSGNNDFNIADKITASNFKQKETGGARQPLESKPEIELPKPDEIFIGPELYQKLSQIIEEINSAYGKNYDTDIAAKSALQIRDLLLKDEKLKASAKANELKDFTFTYNDSINGALLNGSEQTEDFFHCYSITKNSKRN
jgi:type I restriction enzyme R subunit